MLLKLTRHLAQLRHHSTAGDVHAADADPQLPRHFGNRLASTLLCQNACHVVAVTVRRTSSAAQRNTSRRYSKSNNAESSSGRSVSIFEQQVDVAASHTHSPVLGPRQKVEDCVSSDAKQPISKAAARRIGSPPMNGAGDGDQHLLAQFFRVGVLQALASSQAVEQRKIDFDEFLPGFDIVRVGQASDQASSSIWSRCHRRAATSFLTLNTPGMRRIFHVNPEKVFTNTDKMISASPRGAWQPSETSST